MQTACGVFKLLPTELRLDTTLKCGQSFRWRRIEQTTGVIFRSCLRGRLITLKQADGEIKYWIQVPPGTSLPDDSQRVLQDYLNLKVNLLALYKQWNDRDPHFSRVSPDFLGLRMLRQDPFENLLCFICSSNNNIPRITQMVNTLCRQYGDEIATVDGETYFDFPSIEKLLHPSLTDELRAAGFGYRAKFIASTCQALSALSPDYLEGLRQLNYCEAHAELLQFLGVGAKVADCVCLMSLDKHEAVPVDTHVLQIAQRDYKFRSKGSSMTKVTYNQIKNFFISLWGDYAGWAHSVLFTADLRAFKLATAQVAFRATPTVEVKTETLDEKPIGPLNQTKVERAQDAINGIADSHPGQSLGTYSVSRDGEHTARQESEHGSRRSKRQKNNSENLDLTEIKVEGN